MGKIFTNENLESFFEQMIQGEEDFDELIEKASVAISKINKELNIGRVDISIEGATSFFGRETDKVDYVLFIAESYKKTTPVLCEYAALSGGSRLVKVYPLERIWTKDEKKDIKRFCEFINIIFSRQGMRRTLKNLMMRDLQTNVYNIQTFSKIAAEIEAKGQLLKYDAIFFNISNFRYVNKRLPYSEGDKLLRVYAGKVEEFIGKDGILARLGGDNFVCMILSERLEGFIRFLKNVVIEHKYDRKIYEFRFGATIGCARLRDVKTARELMNCVSIAYSVARKTGTDVLYNEQMLREMMNSKEMMAHFQEALKKEEFKVYFQPKVSVKDRNLVGAESLVRWIHDGDEIFPSRFIPLLEQNDCICDLDMYLLEKVCQFIRKREDENKENTCISVNFSKRNLNNQALVEQIISVIDKYKVPHKYIEIELTESQNYEDFQRMNSVIHALHNFGINVSIDDFGTGSSSLSMLKSTSPRVIKIDKMFVTTDVDCPDFERNKAIFSDMVRLVKNCGALIVVEGVESEEQMAIVTEAGCDIIQGYIFDGPLSESEFITRLDNKSFYNS